MNCSVESIELAELERATESVESKPIVYKSGRSS